MLDCYEYWVETQQRTTLAGQVYTNDDMMKDLNKRGADGWELVSCMGGNVSATQHLMQFVWKRRVSERANVLLS